MNKDTIFLYNFGFFRAIEEVWFPIMFRKLKDFSLLVERSKKERENNIPQCTLKGFHVLIPPDMEGMYVHSRQKLRKVKAEAGGHVYITRGVLKWEVRKIKEVYDNGDICAVHLINGSQVLLHANQYIAIEAE